MKPMVAIGILEKKTWGNLHQIPQNVTEISLQFLQEIPLTPLQNSVILSSCT